MNKIKCGDCAFYDQMKKASPSGLIGVRTGRCMKYSLYPFKDPEGHKFPADVKRAEEGTHPKPSQIRIVQAKQLVRNCLYGTKK